MQIRLVRQTAKHFNHQRAHIGNPNNSCLAHATRNWDLGRLSQHRQLFDSLSTLATMLSISSVSSYANSIVSSNFNPSSSTTSSSSAPSSLFGHKPREESKTSAFSTQLKKLYCYISALKTKIIADSGEPQDESHIVIKGGPSIGTEEAEMARWKKATDDHKK